MYMYYAILKTILSLETLERRRAKVFDRELNTWPTKIKPEIQRNPGPKVWRNSIKRGIKGSRKKARALLN